MAQDYKVLQFRKGDFQDQNGNYWCDMALEGVGEPVRIVVKDPTQFHDDMTLYGQITDETSKAGKPYQRFRREKKPEVEEAPRSAAPATKKEWQPRDDDRIVAQWAIGQAVQLLGSVPSIKNEQLELQAKAFFAMVDRVKGSSETLGAVNIKTNDDGTISPIDPAKPSSFTSGYDKFKASKPGAKVEQSEEDFEKEYQESLAALVNSGEPMDLSEIPF